MKRLFTFLFVVSIISASLWAADVSVTENYVTAPTTGVKTSRTSYNGRYTQWFYRNARSKTTDKLIDNTRGFWLSRTSGSSCYLESTLEGGIKSVAFNWRQFAGGEADNDNGYNFILNINVDGTTKDIISFVGAESYATADQSYSKVLLIKKSTAKLTLQNLSTQSDGTSAGGRLVIGPITVVPYLLYTQKDVIIGTKQHNYRNEELINNTGDEDAITYSSSSTGIATIDPTTGVVTPVSAGKTTITATWEDVTTSYTLNVVDNILVENFSKVSKLSQITSEATWKGDLWDWNVRNTRRGIDDTLGLVPRIQATALRKGSGETYIYTNASIEGGVKHLAFDWRQWATATSPLTFKAYYSADKENWGDAVATQSVDAASAATPHEFNEDVDNGTMGNAYLKLEYTSGAGHAVIGAMKITPWLLYTDKKMKTIHVGNTYTNTDLIDNTGGSATYQSSDNTIATINSSGQVTGVSEGYVTITAKYNNVTTTYPLYVVPATNYETFSNEATTSTYAASTESAAGDACTWQTRYGGINSNEVVVPYAAFLRAPRDGQTKVAYIESGLLNGGISKLTFYWNLVGNEPNVNEWDIRVLINGREVERLSNAAGKALDGINSRQENMVKCEIEDIDEPGMFTIRFENHSTITGEYTEGNKARFVIDNLFWENFAGPIVLDEAADNSALLVRNNGSTQDVNTNRTLIGGAWNTLCLPFAIDKTNLGDGVNVQLLNDASIDGDALTITFSALEGSTLTAGTPYLVKPANNVDLTGFTDKSIVSLNGTTSVGNGLVTLNGIFSPTELTGGDKSILFVGAEDANGDNLFYPSETANLKGMRAYFKINEEVAGAPIRRARFVTDQKDTTTGIEQTLQSAGAIKRMEDRQLVIIRDGVRYNIFGCKL